MGGLNASASSGRSARLVEDLKSFGLFEERILFANLVNDNRVDYCSAALLHAPHEQHHAKDAITEHAEVVAVYDAGNVPREPTQLLPVAERLTDIQNDIIDKLRAALTFTNVDCHLSKHFVSPMVAHSSLSGTWTRIGLQGGIAMAKVVELVTK